MDNACYRFFVCFVYVCVCAIVCFNFTIDCIINRWNVCSFSRYLFSIQAFSSSSAPCARTVHEYFLFLTFFVVPKPNHFHLFSITRFGNCEHKARDEQRIHRLRTQTIILCDVDGNNNNCVYLCVYKCAWVSNWKFLLFHLFGFCSSFEMRIVEKEKPKNKKVFLHKEIMSSYLLFLIH